MAALDVNEAINDVIVLLQRELATHRVSQRLSLAPGLPPVMADRIQLQQVLINLVMHGIEAMQTIKNWAREPELCSRRDDAGHVVVEVRDRGTGIAPEHQDRLFQAFFSTKPGGLGMGLSICRSIIEGHGGRLWASGNGDSGATFQFALPPLQNAA